MTVLELLEELEQAGVELWEASGELRFRAPSGVMTEERREILRSSKEDVLEQLRSKTGRRELEPRPEARYDPFPLTEVQEAYLLGRNEAFAYGGVACHGYAELALPAAGTDRVGAAWNALVRHHDMLRAVIEPGGRQRVQPTVPEYELETLDLRSAGRARTEAALEAVRDEMSHAVYPAGSWPLFGLRLSFLDEGPRLHLSIDFLVADLVSTQRLLDELHGLIAEPGRPLVPPEITFRDYVLAEREARNPGRLEDDRRYWRERLRHLPPPPELPLEQRRDRGRPRFRRFQTRLGAAEWAALRRRANEHDVTPTVAVLAAYAEVVGRWSARPRFTLNLTLQNRQPLHPQVDRLVGDFTSTSLLAVEGDPAASFAARAQALQARLWSDLDHRLVSGIEVAQAIGRREGAGASLFPVVFTGALGLETPAGAVADVLYGITQTPQVWIDCQALEANEALVVNWDVREGVVRGHVLDAMFGAFEQLLGEAAVHNEVWDASSPVSLPASQRLRRRRSERRSPLSDGLLQEGVLARAIERPDRPAVVAGGRTLSYGELAGRALSVASALRDAGIRPGDLVAIVMGKGPEQPVAALGILLAGAAYVPVDSVQPPARRRTMLTNAGARLVLTQSWLAEDTGSTAEAIAVDELPAAQVPDALPPRTAGPDDVAYVVYTSGSTGTPKGVVITHRGALNTIEDVNRHLGVDAGDRVLGLSNLGFDLSVYDVFGLLAAGGALVLPEHERRADPSHWAELVTEHKVTIWNSVPAQMHMLCEQLERGACREAGAWESALRLVLLSGDSIPVDFPARVRRLLPAVRLACLGGATEASIWSVAHDACHVHPDARSVPYGPPLANQSVEVLDAALRPCPDFVRGEIYIGGAGLARGYLGDEANTAERFLAHPRTGERLYRTGDLGRFLPDGSIELLGRDDGQVKIRGHRIELAEVEAVLAAHPALAAAAVVAAGAEPLERRLVAFAQTAREVAPPPTDREALIAAASATAVDRDAHRWYSQLLDRAALLSMLRALRRRRALDEAARGEEDVLAAVPPRFRRLVRRWLRALEQHSLAHRDEATGRWRSDAAAPDSVVEAAWALVVKAAEGVEDAGVVDYFRTSALRLPELIGGAAEPARLLFPVPVHRRAVASKAATRLLAATVRRIADRWPYGTPLRVLEVGSAAGGVGFDVAPGLADLDVDYLFTNPSPLVVEEARKNLAGCSTVRFAVVDADGDLRAQGLAPSSFDVVLAADTLHNCVNVHDALRRLRELVTPGGWLVFSEVTRDHYAIMASVELLLRADDAHDFTDERGGRDRTFLSIPEWLDALSAAGGDSVLCLPQGDDLFEASGIRVFAARLRADRARVSPGELQAHVAGRLPASMVPAAIEIVDALPRTPNGKLDREALRRRLADGGAVRHLAVSPPGEGDAVERQLACLWADVLEVDDVPRDRALLELGGDSLRAARIAGLVGEEIPGGATMPFDELLGQLLDGRSIAELAAALRSPAEPAADGEAERPSPVRRLRDAEGGTLRVLVHNGSGDLDAYEQLVGELPTDGPLLGVVVDDPAAYLQTDPALLPERSAEAYARALLDAGCGAVRVVGCGPGRALALETARRLIEAGVVVEGLVLIAGFAGSRPIDASRHALRAHTLRAAELYRPAPYPGDITVLCSDGGGIEPWAEACLGDLHVVHARPGDRASLAEALGAATR